MLGKVCGGRSALVSKHLKGAAIRVRYEPVMSPQLMILDSQNFYIFLWALF